MIESYSFGLMTINGQKYSSDLIIFPDKIKSSWWRESGHKLTLTDLEDVLKERPEILVVGTGAAGLMKVEEEVHRFTRVNGVTLIMEKTKEAVLSFNNYTSKQKTIGAFHLTC